MAVLLPFGWVLSRCFRAPLGVLLVMKTLEDGQYVVIKAYKFTIFEIWGDFNVLSYIVCPRYPYIRVYRLMVQNPYVSFFDIHVLWKKIPVWGLYT